MQGPEQNNPGGSAEPGGAAPQPRIPKTRLGGLGLSVRAIPVFDLRKQSASTFFCVPSRVSSSQNAFGYHLLQSVAEATLPEVDLELVDAAIGYARRFDQDKVIAAIGTTVSYATLADPRSRAAYLAKLKSASFANNPLVVKIELIPPGTPTERLAAIVGYVKSGGWRAFMSVSDFRSRTWTSGTISATGIGTMLDPGDDAAIVREKAQTLLALCAAQGAVSFVDGVVLKEAVDAAVGAGVRFGTGPALSLSVFPMTGGLPKVPLPQRGQAL